MESPIHLIGHSRGGSLIGALAEDLGQAGIWVDHVTYLDPHPLAFPEDWGNDDIGATRNIVFADSYWRQGGPAAPNGEPVDGAHNNQLQDSVLVGEGYDGPLGPHSDVHLWYHGTIDTDGDIFDGEVGLTSAETLTWYGGDHPGRSESGYDLSRVGSQTRPGAGISEDLGGQGERDPILDHSVDRWPSLLELTVDTDDLTIAVGEILTVAFYLRDYDSGTTFALFLDDDRNPYNNSDGQRQIGNSSSYYPTGDQLMQDDDFRVALNGVDTGQFYVFGELTDEIRTRYVYSPESITITAAPSSSIDLFGSSANASDGALTPGDRFNFSYQISNSGAADAGEFGLEWYLSQDSIIEKSDHRIGRQNILGLAAGATTPAAIKGLVLPTLADPIWNGNGTYYVGMIVDPDGAIAESKEANNRNAGLGLDFDSIQISGFVPPPEELIVKISGDESDGIHGDDLSLREAIKLANEDPGNSNYDVITFDIGTENPEIDLNSVLGQLTITRDLSIVGTNSNAAGGRVSIDGQDAVRIFNIDVNNDSPAIDVQLWDLTLKRGSTGGKGGAIFHDNRGGTLSVFDSKITGNSADNEGGGIYNNNGNLTVVRSNIRNNSAGDDGGGIYSSSANSSENFVSITDSKLGSNLSNDDGGGVSITNGTLSITGGSIHDNYALETGGGIRSRNGTLDIVGTAIEDNGWHDLDEDGVFDEAEPISESGGGIYASNSTTTIVDSRLITNRAKFNGGGIYSQLGTLDIVDSTVSLNMSFSEDGGGIRSNSTTRITGTTISENAARTGGGVYYPASNGTSLTIVNSTVSGNFVTEHGGGLEVGGSVSIVNSTITGNRVDSDGSDSGDGGGIRSSGTTTLDNTIVAGNLRGSGSTANDISGTVSGNNNLVGDASTAGGLGDGTDGNIVGNSGTGTIPIGTVLETSLEDNLGKTETHALKNDGPAIDGGLNSAANSALLLFDQRGIGFDRIAGDFVDIGALEFDSLNQVVDTIVDESDDDFSTGDLSLREAIERANANPGPDTITFDIGNNNPEIDLLVELGELSIVDALSIDGINTNVTGGRVSIDGQDAVRVIEIDAPGAEVALSNLTIRRGRASGSDHGGGLANDGANLSITNSTITENVSQSHGGGIRSKLGTLTITNSTISKNMASLKGGGVRTSLNNTTTITGSIISENVSQGEGGGIYSSNSGTLEIVDSTVSLNTSGDECGGGIRSVNTTTTITGSTVSENEASLGGGVYYTSPNEQWLTIVNSTISGNSATTDAGGLELSGSVSIVNSTITGNRTDSDGNDSGDGGGIRSSGTTTLDNTIVAGNLSGTGSTANDIFGTVSGNNNLVGDAATSGGLEDGTNGNIVGDSGSGTIPIVTILNTLLRESGGPTATHALVVDSPGIDSGSSDGFPTSDQRGISRPQDGDGNGTVLVDIGAFELESPDLPTLDNITDVIIDEDAAEQTVNLTGIGASGGESRPLQVTASSSDAGLVPKPGVTYTSANSTGSIAFTPVSDQSGTVTITVTVEDGGLDDDLDTAGDNATFSRTFDVTVRAKPIQRIASDTLTKGVAPGSTIDIPIIYQTLDASG
ncbi:MAG: choice-of-anchor Q domain-containing protein, partial [Planctomycetaceae bacterium]